MKFQLLMIASLLSFVLVPASAEEATTAGRHTHNPRTVSCPMTETSQVNVSFNSPQTDLAQVKSLMNDRLKEIEALAKEAGVDKFEMQSMNYSIYANNPGSCNCSSQGSGMYQLSGNMNFNVHPSEKATELMVLLNNKGYASGLNVNMYRQCQ